MSFDQALKDKNRNITFLRKGLLNPTLLEIIDTKMYLLSKPFEMLKNASLQSVFDYFDKIVNIMIGIYSVFISLLTVFLIVFFLVIFKRLKNGVKDTNILLNLIPIKTALERETQVELQKFLIN